MRILRPAQVVPKAAIIIAVAAHEPCPDDSPSPARC